MADMPNFGEGGDTPVGRQRWAKMMRNTIERDFNHPAIFSWSIFNETWGFGGQVEFIKHFEPKEQKQENQNVPGAVSGEAVAAANVPNEIATAVCAPEKKRLDNV